MRSIVTMTVNPAVDRTTNVEVVDPEVKLRCATAICEPGGGGINVSRALRRLGGESIAWYTAGGSSGRHLRELLDHEGLVHLATLIRGSTRESFIVTERSTGKPFRFGLPGPALTETEWQQGLQWLARLSPRPSLVVASGSLPPGVPDDFYARLARACRELGEKLILDTAGAPLRAALEAGVYLAKPSAAELAEITGVAADDEQALAAEAEGIVRRGGAEAVVVSLGAAGAILATAAGSRRLYAPRVEVCSLVGGGDSMVAGIALKLAAGARVEDAALFGVAAGTAAVQAPGTQLCRRADAERLYRRLCGLPEEEGAEPALPAAR